MLLWAESFEHYGTVSGGRSNMSLGAWAAFTAGNGTLPYIDNTHARTGTYGLRFDHNYLATDGTRARRVFGSSLTTVGVGFGIYFPSLPATNDKAGVDLRDVSNASLIRVYIQTDGSLAVRVAGSVIGTSDSVITAAAYHHIEVKAVIDSVVGSVEIRVNGIVEFLMDNIDTGTTPMTQVAWGTMSNGGAGTFSFWIDDLFAWDGTGSEANDFLGTQRVTTIFPTADTAVADWVPNTGAAWDAINDLVQDGDTTYILASDAADISEFEIDTLPPETSEIVGVYIPTLAKLDDAGTGQLQVSLVSNSVASEGPDTVLTAGYAYWGSVHTLDPDTGLPWTKSGLEAALLRFEKTL